MPKTRSAALNTAAGPEALYAIPQALTWTQSSKLLRLVLRPILSPTAVKLSARAISPTGWLVVSLDCTDSYMPIR